MNALNAKTSDNYSDWGTLLKTWLAANYINASTGRYGYMNEPVLKDLKAPTVATGTTSLRLYPGEGVYSITSSSGSTYPQGQIIKYAGLNRTSPQVSDTSTYAGGALLTYNINTDIKGDYDQGTTTGVSSNAVINSQVRFVTPPLSGPYRIDAGDLLRRNGGNYAGISGMDFSDSLKALKEEAGN
jgi:hypothetical protein